MKILVTPTSLHPSKPSEALTRLTKYCDNLVFNPYGRPLTEDELSVLLADCDGYLAGLDYITEKALQNSPHLKAISRYGAGYDRVDIKAASARDISVSNTPGANAQAVAELSVAMLLSLARQLTYLHTETAAGRWTRTTGTELHGKTLGIIGLGAIGRQVAQCLEGFHMRTLAYDPYINKDYCLANSITPTSLDTLLQESDFITLHLPLTPETHHLIGKEALTKVKPTAIIVNASRGGIIDEQAAYEALTANHLGALGLDAFEQEPPGASPLFALPNVIATPHTGAHTKEATTQMALMSVDNLIAMLESTPCPHIIN